MSSYNLERVKIMTGEEVWEVSETRKLETGKIIKVPLARFMCYVGDPEMDQYEVAEKYYEARMENRVDEQILPINLKDLAGLAWHE